MINFESPVGAHGDAPLLVSVEAEELFWLLLYKNVSCHSDPGNSGEGSKDLSYYLNLQISHSVRDDKRTESKNSHMGS